MPSTSVYGFPYQGLNDPPHGPDLGRNLAERIEQVLQSDLTLGGGLTLGGNLTVPGDAAVSGKLTAAIENLSAASIVRNSTFVSSVVAYGQKVRGLNLTVISIYCILATDIVPSNGNITGDPLLVTLPVGWRPVSTCTTVCGNGSMDGELQIDTGGACTIRSANATAVSGSGLRFSAVYFAVDA